MSWFWFILTITCYLAMVMVNDKINDDINMYLHRGLFWWPCRCTGAMRCASPNAACLGLLLKPLSTAIEGTTISVLPWRLLEQQQKNNIKNWVNFAGHFDGRGGVPVQYCMLDATGCRHWVSIVTNSSHRTYHCCFLCFSLSTCRKKVACQCKGSCFQ